MAGALQGFVKNLNLAENTQDRNALNNLGEAPIADDISLFINNNNNKSTITVFVSEYDRISGLVTIINNTAELSRQRSAVFTNKDPVSLEYTDGTLIRDGLFIRDSDGEVRFGFSTDIAGSNEFTFRPTGDFVVVRSDKVVLANLENLGAEQTTASFSSGLSSTDAANEGGSFGVIDNLSYDEAFQEIYSYLDVAKYQARKKFVSDQDVATDDNFELEGTFTIRDPGNTIVEEGLSVTSPGLFISDPESPVGNIQKILAFSDTFNPWSQTNTGGTDYLTTSSSAVTAGELIMNQNFDITGVTPISESGTVSAATFTHKVPINVNGVTYFLCLKST
jgi:hypothetical protein